MTANHKPVTNQSQLPHGVAWLPRSQMLQMLGIADSQLRRDQALLAFLQTPGFDYQPGDTGFSRESARCLWEFRQLVHLYKRRERAIAQINELMEKIYESERLESCQTA